MPVSFYILNINIKTRNRLASCALIITSNDIDAAFMIFGDLIEYRLTVFSMTMILNCRS